MNILMGNTSVLQYHPYVNIKFCKVIDPPDKFQFWGRQHYSHVCYVSIHQAAIQNLDQKHNHSKLNY